MLILALNEEDQVAAAVHSANAPGVEVVVVDGGSTDATCERAVAAGARVVGLEGGKAGRAQQMDAGVRNTRGEIVLFLHADTRLPLGFDSAIQQLLGDRRAVGGAFGFRFDEPGVALRLVEWGVKLRVAIFGMPYGDQALFVRRSVLDEIGGVPQAVIMEDLDLVSSMQRHGQVAQIAMPVTTSARRYLRHGVLRTMLRNWVMASGWVLGIDRNRLASWYRR